nr:uncharacterized protein LOC119178308 [Rhipicephalus microplus]
MKRTGKKWPTLKPSSVKLSCYLGKLPVLGQLDMKVAYKCAVVDCSLVVLNCPGPSLCERDLIFQLSNAGSPVLNLTAEAGSPTSLLAMDDIVNEFRDIFSAKLGCISGTPVHLQLREGATPKFYHQPLLGLLKAEKPTPALAAARIRRWALYLDGFRYKLQYSPGSTQETEEWTLPPGTAMYARNYGQGEKWTPGKVQSTAGSRMVTIQTPAGVVRRHIDQMRSRPSPAFARSGAQRDQDEGSPPAAGAPTPTGNEGKLNEQPADQVAPAQP